MNQPQKQIEIAGRISHVSMLTSLAAKVQPHHTALLVVDMQNDWVAPRGILGKEGRNPKAAQELAERLPGFVDAARGAGVLVVFIRNHYTTDSNAYLSDAWLEQAARKRSGGYTEIPVCAPNSWEADYYGELRPKSGDVVVTKHRYSAFHNTDLDTVLRSHGIRSVIMTGVGTNVCVETTARDAFMRDYYVVFTKDGTAAATPADHEGTLRNIDRFFGEVCALADLIAIWQKHEAPVTLAEVPA